MTIPSKKYVPGNPPGPGRIPPRLPGPSDAFATVRRMWDALVAWFQSPGGARVLQTAVIPALAILVAGVLAALIARAALRALIRRSDRMAAASAVAALVAAARAAADANEDRSAERRAARLRTEA